MRFKDRWGSDVAERGFTQCPNALFTRAADLGLKSRHVHFIGYLLTLDHGRDLPRPTITAIAAGMNADVQTARRAKDELEEMGYLGVYTRMRRTGDHRQTANEYDLQGFRDIVDALESDECPPEDFENLRAHLRWVGSEARARRAGAAA